MQRNDHPCDDAPQLTHNARMSYRPTSTISGPTYSAWFKMLATLFIFGLCAYGVSFAMRFPLVDWSNSLIVFLSASLMVMALSFTSFLGATTTIDDRGIMQTSVLNRQVDWVDVRSAKLIGIPYAGWLSPPRLVVRTGTTFYTFNGGTPELLDEFARISLAFQMKPDD